MNDEEIRNFIKEYIKSIVKVDDEAEEESNEETDSVDEKVTTMNVPGYQTPYAFKKKDDDDEEDERERKLIMLKKKFGWTKAESVTSQEAAQDFKAYFGPLMKRSSDLKETIVNEFLTPVKQLNEGDPGKKTLGSAESIKNAVGRIRPTKITTSASSSGNTLVKIEDPDQAISVTLNVREAYLDY